jgi:hypothetical protein
VITGEWEKGRKLEQEKRRKATVHALLLFSMLL